MSITPAPQEPRRPSTRGRQRRGRQSEIALAAWLRVNGFPYAEPTSASARGVDLTGTPGISVEVKARRELSLMAWLRQARRNAGKQLPLLIVRNDGQGIDRIGEWAAVMTLQDFVELWFDDERGAS